MYGCGIHKNGCSRTAFYDERCWRFSQFGGHVACREYTLPRDDESSTPKGWICGDTKIGPVFEVVTNYHEGKPGVEIRIESISKDGSRSWIRITKGLNKSARDPTEKMRIHEEGQGGHYSKYGETRNTRLENCGKFSQTGIPIHSRKWINVEPQRNQSNPVAKMMNTLLRHTPLPRENGAIEFWRLRMEFVSGFTNYVHWSIRTWIDLLRRGGGQKKIFQYCTDSTEQEKLFISELPKAIQERILWIRHYRTMYYPDNFFEYSYHVGCYFSMHDSERQKRKRWSTNGILYSRKSFGHALSRAERSRSDKVPNCCLQAKSGEYTTMQCIGSILGLLRKGIEVFPD